MTIWRMSFRCGNQGYEMWPHCFEAGIAAITYDPLERVNLSKYSLGEPKMLWAQLAPSQQASLRRVAYEMKKGDVIYVKQGPQIVSRGKVKDKYIFDKKLRFKDPWGTPWAHQVPVDWEKDFTPVNILLGSEPTTVLPLTGERLKKLESEIKTINRATDEFMAIEGETYKSEAIFRKRNRALIEAKKANSDYCCEVCGFNFKKCYGPLGDGYIIAHHKKLVSSGVSKSTLDDIVLLCANCHVMVHTKNPPIQTNDLQKSVIRKH